MGNAKLLGLSRLNLGNQLWSLHVPHLDLNEDNIIVLWSASLSSPLSKNTLSPHSYIMSRHCMSTLDLGFGSIVSLHVDEA